MSKLMSVQGYTQEDLTSVKIKGKVCPSCGHVGTVLYETSSRIVYECPEAHQYETKKK